MSAPKVNTPLVILCGCGAKVSTLHNYQRTQFDQQGAVSYLSDDYDAPCPGCVMKYHVIVQWGGPPPPAS